VNGGGHAGSGPFGDALVRLLLGRAVAVAAARGTAEEKHRRQRVDQFVFHYGFSK
jgi:hypothetical protein